MSALDEIKSEIKTIAESVSGIGTVYERLVYAKDQAQVKELFVKDTAEGGPINCLMFRQVKRIADAETRNGNELLIDRTWKFVLIYGYNKETNSEETFDNLSETLCKTFNANPDLNGKVNEHSYFNMSNKTDNMYHSVLCHWAEFEMITNSN